MTVGRFYDLTVTDIRRETRDAVVLTLDPRPEDRPDFDFIEGQYLTFRRNFGREELRRCYSICTGRHEALLRVGIKKVTGGRFSSWVNEQLGVGDVLQALRPMGQFHTPHEGGSDRYYLGFAAGSGITPVLSIIKTVLAREPTAHFTLVYVNRDVRSIMFREELEDLKNCYVDRLAVLHILKAGPADAELFVGRLSPEKLDILFRRWIDPATVELAFICGPAPMMEAVAASLRKHGLGEHRIRCEFFTPARLRGAPLASRPRAPCPEGTLEATVTLDGATLTFAMPRCGVSLLDAALEQDLFVPFACRAGVCSACRARVVEGEFEMADNYALDEQELARGYVLACQCFPTGEKIMVSFDE